MDFKNYKFGAKISPIDERNYKISKLIGTTQTIPEEFSLDISTLKKQDQGAINQCVAESLCYSTFIDESKSGNEKAFSRGWVYGNRKSTDYMGQGMYCKEALDNLLVDGVPYEEDFPIEEEFPFIYNAVQVQRDKLLSKAQEHKIKAYAQIMSDEDAKISLINGHPVSIAIPVCDSFITVGKDGILPMANPDKEAVYGYHQLTLYGFDKTGWLGINSWLDWGNDELFHMPFGYPIMEGWSVIGNDVTITPPTPVNTYYRVQIGAFRLRENANKLSEEVSNKGIANCLMIVDGLFKIQCGSFISYDNAVKMRDKLISLGYKDAFITKIQK